MQQLLIDCRDSLTRMAIPLHMATLGSCSYKDLPR